MEGDTTITTNVKVKDPKRVEAGRRVGKISKEAKARKAAERKAAEECIESANLLYYVVGLTATVGLGYGAYKYFSKPKEVQQQVEQVEEPPKKVILTTYK